MSNVSTYFPHLKEWVERFAERAGGHLCRVYLLTLPPKMQIRPHIDRGSYFESRDRFHVVLSSATPPSLACGGESARMNPGDIWWFDNQQEYSVTNQSNDLSFHLIVDVCRVRASVRICPLLCATHLGSPPSALLLIQVPPLFMVEFPPVPPIYQTNPV